MSDPSELEARRTLYDRDFWLAYVANLLLVGGTSVHFRFAEFVAALGGTEVTSGTVIRVGTLAAVACRLCLAPLLDRYGVRPCWLVSTALFVAGNLTFALLDRLAPALWIARAAYAAGIAGMVSCSMIFIQFRAPGARRTEAIGSLGSSGFLGTIVGAAVGDILFEMLAPGRSRYLAMFGGAAGFGLAYALIVAWLTRGDVRVRPSAVVGPLTLVIRNWPGSIVLVAFVQGMVLVVTTVFLTRYATAMRFRGIGSFFLTYALTAFTGRWLFRGFAAAWGRHAMVLGGLTGLAAGQLLFLTASSEWLFVPPALATGVGFALLSPAVISLVVDRIGTSRVGSGTALGAGFTDAGMALFAPLLGWLIDLGNATDGTRGFAWMFCATASAVGATMILYALTSARHIDRGAGAI